MPVPIYRLLSLLCAPILIVVAALLISTNDKVDPLFAFVGVYIGAFAIFVLLTIWSVRFADSKSGANRFSIGSIFIATSILAIYLAYFRLLPYDWEKLNQFNIGSVFQLVIQFLIGSFVTTFILALFTESVLHIAAKCKRSISNLRQDIRNANQR